MKKKPVMPVGVDDFKEVITQYYFVDKTRFIKELINGHSKVTLITRPRRFGKTLMMSMLYYFFTNENAAENRGLFAGSEVERAGEEYMAEQGTRPVVFLSLKDANINAMDYDSLVGIFKEILRELYGQFRYLLQSEALADDEKKYFSAILQKTVPAYEMQLALKNLSAYLQHYHGRKVLLLIDEYDAPIQAAWENGYYKEAIAFMRGFLGSALKTNTALDFAVLTGVLRIAKESIFSALNNLEVASVLNRSFADIFGFTQTEIEKIAADFNCPEKISEIKIWYDGYNFSGQEIYNPWSVINYFKYDYKPAAYWINTSGNSIITHLVEQADDKQMKNLHTLMCGKPIYTSIKEGFIYDEIYSDHDALYTMLLTTGYLKKIPDSTVDDMEGINDYCALVIPNREIRRVYAREIISRCNRLGGERIDTMAMLRHLLSGAAEEFAEELNSYTQVLVSYYDAANKESFYHGFMLGMMALLVPQYTVRSNRESGYGRFDLAIFPKRPTLAGVIMELKVAKDENELEQVAETALEQIETKDYPAEFRSQGIETVWKYGIAFCGKKLAIKRG